MSSSTIIGDYLQQGAGAPSTAPPVKSGTTAIYWDTTGHQGYYYDWSGTPQWRAGGSGSSGFNPFASGTLTPPVASTFTLTQNANLGGTATKTDLASGRGVKFLIPSNTASAHNDATIGVTGPSSTALTLKALVQRTNLVGADGSCFGLYLKDSSPKYLFMGFYLGTGGAPQIFMAPQATLGSFGSNVWAFTTAEYEPPALCWLQMVISSGNLISSWSADGETFEQIDSRTVASLSSQFNGTVSECGILYDNFAGTSGLLSAARSLNVYSFTASTP